MQLNYAGIRHESALRLTSDPLGSIPNCQPVRFAEMPLCILKLWSRIKQILRVLILLTAIFNCELKTEIDMKIKIEAEISATAKVTLNSIKHNDWQDGGMVTKY